MSADEKKIPEYLQKLIDGCSTYVKISIQFWIPLAFFSVVTLAPSIDKEGKFNMPLGFGAFDKQNFYLFSFLISGTFIIGFGSAFAQAMRARKLVQRVVETLKYKMVFNGNVYLEDVVDTLLYPALNRVAPLVQVLHGKKQFFPEAKDVSMAKNWLAGIYYILLKVLSVLILYAFPAESLIVAYRSFITSAHSITLIVLIDVMGLFSVISLVTLCFLDVKYAVGAFKRIVGRTRFNESMYH
jgi:hypothetical protein